VGELLEKIKKAAGDLDHPVEIKEGTPGDQFGMVADIEKVKKDLDWKPTISLEEGLKKVLDFEMEKA